MQRERENEIPMNCKNGFRFFFNACKSNFERACAGNSWKLRLQLESAFQSHAVALSFKQTNTFVCVCVCVRERSLQRKCRLNKGEKIRQQREMPNKRTSSQANNKICVFSCRHPFHCFSLLLLLLLLLFLYLAYYSILICFAFLFGNL